MEHHSNWAVLQVLSCVGMYVIAPLKNGILLVTCTLCCREIQLSKCNMWSHSRYKMMDGVCLK